MTHALDASVVRQYHLWGRKSNLGTASVHDAIVMNINELDPAINAIRGIYADFADFPQIKATLDALRKEGLPDNLYFQYLEEAKTLGYFDRQFTRGEMLAPIKEGYSYYGWGP